MPIACGVNCALLLDVFLLSSFSSLSLLLLLDEPQPRKASGGDHHHNKNAVVNHRSYLNQCSRTSARRKSRPEDDLLRVARSAEPVELLWGTCAGSGACAGIRTCSRRCAGTPFLTSLRTPCASFLASVLTSFTPLHPGSLSLSIRCCQHRRSSCEPERSRQSHH